MNAANLINLIQATSEIAGLPAVSTGESQPADGFLLALQQYVQPQLATLAGRTDGGLTVIAGDGLAQSGLTASDAATAPPISADSLLVALTDCLTALLGDCSVPELQSDDSQVLGASNPQPVAPQAPAEALLTLLSDWRQLLADLAAVLGDSDARVAVESSQPVLTPAPSLGLSLPCLSKT